MSTTNLTIVVSIILICSILSLASIIVKVQATEQQIITPSSLEGSISNTTTKVTLEPVNNTNSNVHTTKLTDDLNQALQNRLNEINCNRFPSTDCYVLGYI